MNRLRGAERVEMMSRAEYLRKYPNGVSRRGKFKLDGAGREAYREWRSAIKRDDWEQGRSSRLMWSWCVGIALIVLCVVGVVAGFGVAAALAIFAVFAVCFVIAGVNAPW